MIVIDKALREREAAGRPVRFAMVGAGFMAQGVANQVVNSVRGMTLVAIANRHPDKARRVYEYAGVEGAVAVDSVAALGAAMSRGIPAYTDDPFILCDTEGIDCILEVTGSIEYGAGVVLRAIEQGKHVVVMNPELDGTVGPILKVKADQAGVVYTTSDGDQPGVEGNLYRYVTGLGITPLLMGNIKGLQDPYRNPTTQQGFAEKWGQNPWMVTSFADGSKCSFEQATVANAFDLSVLSRGMSRGYEHHGHVDELTTSWHDVDTLRAAGGVVDYVVGAQPNPGVFCLGTHDDPKQRHYLNLYKLGEGPLYSFYAPYHLCHFETPTSIARAVIHHDPTMAPAAPRVEVVTIAKVDLKAGQELDRYGGYLHYGEAENATTAAEEDLLPQGVADGCVLVRDVPKDQAVTYADVTLPAGRLCDRLRAEQAERFGLLPAPA